MVNSTSIPEILNVNASTKLIQQGYHTKDYEDDFPTLWVNGDTLYVYGNLTWENGIGIANVYVNITIVSSIDEKIIYAFNDTVKTDNLGRFNGTLNVGLNWPPFRSETKIVVEFNPVDNRNYGVPDGYFIIGSRLEFT
jgi:hypothetical protein